MTVDVYLLPDITVVKMWGFLHVRVFPSGFSVPLGAGELPGPIDNYSHCHPGTKAPFPSSRPTDTSSGTKWLCIPCFDALKFNRSCFLFVRLFPFLFFGFLFSFPLFLSLGLVNSEKEVQFECSDDGENLCLPDFPYLENAHLDVKESHIPELVGVEKEHHRSALICTHNTLLHFHITWSFSDKGFQ